MENELWAIVNGVWHRVAEQDGQHVRGWCSEYGRNKARRIWWIPETPPTTDKPPRGKVCYGCIAREEGWIP